MTGWRRMGLESPDDQAPPEQEPSEQAVAAFLAGHPDFLTRHPDVLERLIPPPSAEPGERVVDLRAYMVERLRAEGERLRQNQRALISATRANQNTQNRIHAAILFLLDAESLEQLIQTVTTDLEVLLDLDAVTLIIESDGHDLPGDDLAEAGPAAGLPHVLASGVRVAPPGFVDHWLGSGEFRLDGDVQGDEVLFGAAAGLVRSQALARLNVSSRTSPCLLVLGSREPDMFHSGLRTDLLGFLARVLERCIRSWLDLPP